MQWHFDFLGSCCCFTKQGGMGMLGGHSFKNSLFFTEHVPMLHKLCLSAKRCKNHGELSYVGLRRAKRG